MTSAPAQAMPRADTAEGDAGGLTPLRRATTGARFRRAGIRVAALAAAIGAWEAAARNAGNVFLPPPSGIAAWIRRHWFAGPAERLYLSQEVLDQAAASLGRMLTAWACASLLGVALGMLLGRSRLARDLANPVVQLGRSIPPVALLPVFFVLFPGEAMQLALIMTGVIWPVLLHTIAGVRAIDPTLLDAVRVLRIGRARRLAWVLLPAAAPAILLSLRISMSIALILMVVSELYAATDGIGYALLAAQQSFNAPAMWAWIVLIAALGNLGNTVLGFLTRRTLARQGHYNHDTWER